MSPSRAGGGGGGGGGDDDDDHDDDHDDDEHDDVERQASHELFQDEPNGATFANGSLAAEEGVGDDPSTASSRKKGGGGGGGGGGKKKKKRGGNTSSNNSVRRSHNKNNGNDKSNHGSSDGSILYSSDDMASKDGFGDQQESVKCGAADPLTISPTSGGGSAPMSPSSPRKGAPPETKKLLGEDDGNAQQKQRQNAVPGQQQQQQQQQKTKKKRMAEKNPRFKDVEETGQWGTISKKELCVVLTVLLLIVIGIVFMVVDSSRKETEEIVITLSPVSASPTMSLGPSAAPSQRETGTPEERLKALRSIDAAVGAVQEHLNGLPNDLNFYGGKSSDETQSPVIRAASWVILDDPAEEPPNSTWLVARYALSVLYYAMGGDDWINRTGWLQEIRTCDWYGVICGDEFGGKLDELSLPSNNLTNRIPVEISLLHDLRSLLLNSNDITGELPNVALGKMPVLNSIYVDHNRMNGSITSDLRANGVLDTMYLHQNNFTGFFPPSFCPRQGEAVLLRGFSIDCNKVGCLPTCCENDAYKNNPPCF